jgi:hypothetical protein
MVNSLIQLGYSPIVYNRDVQMDAKVKWDPLAIIYKYTESQIPVIALVPGHAITIIGHTFNPNSPITSDATQGEIISSDRWLDSFIIHDDSLGPYRLLPVSEEVRKNLMKTSKKYLLPPRYKSFPYKTINDINNIIIPLPFKVYIPGTSIHESHTKWIFRKDSKFLFDVLNSAKQGNLTSSEFLTSLFSPEKNPIVLRTYFMSSEEYKADLRKYSLEEQNGMVSQLRCIYEDLKMPHFIWITEITNADRLSKEHEEDRTILGEIIIDCTGNRFGFAYLAIHLPGALFLRDIDSDNFSKVFRSINIDGDRPYRHPSRQFNINR